MRQFGYLILCLVGFPLHAQQWVNLNPFDQHPGNKLYSVDFIDEANGWVVGEGGIILHTTDGGRMWEIQHDLLIRGTFTSVDFVDRENGWIVGEGGYIFRTENGGTSWERQSCPVNYDLYDVFFLNKKQGWSLGYGTILHTENGGADWHLQEPVTFEYSGHGITFVDSTKGWIVGTGGLILHTEDGGQTWQNQNSGLEWALNKVSFVDSLNGWACGCSTIRTTNGGQSWQKVDDKSTETIYALSDKEAFAVGWSGQDGFMKHTTDSGKTWLYSNYGSRNYLYDIIFLNRTTGWAVGSKGLIVNTTDGGNTWNIQHERKIDYDMSIGMFVDENNGWFVESFPGRIWHTTDGGRNWVKRKDSTDVWANDIIFINNLKGFVTGKRILDYKSFIWKTTNGGNTWEEIVPTPFISKIFFIDSSIGFAIGSSEILKTTDGGETWHKSSIEPGASFGAWDIFFPDPLHGWSVGMSNKITDTGIILKTSDGGETWNVNVPEASATGKGVFFTDSLHGVVVGSNPPFFEGVVMRTEDGGENWELKYLPCSWLNDVVFTDDSTGWAVGDYGFIWRTIDRGKTWNRIESGTTNDLNRIVFVENGKVGFVFGDKNTLLRYDATPDNVEEKKRDGFPMNFKLYPNYPNPFNGETKIEYELSEDGMVSVKILDLTGKEVVMLFKGHQQLGRHQMLWDGKDKQKKQVSSGMYLCYLQVGHFSQRCKLCVIR
jgi:photosystem II stability/assembly factor-like uncharacterized protein